MTGIEPPRRFHLQRDLDATGTSGTGRVADGVQFTDGVVALRWMTAISSTAVYDSVDDVESIHGHAGATRVVWIDPAPVGWDNADMTCPHCPDGHTPPDGGSQPWAAYLAPVRDGDGQPVTIHVCRSAGAHLAESDAQWVRERLNGGGSR